MRRAHLLDNAIKFTPEGGAVDVSVTTKGRSVQMDFRDTGIGIPGEALPHVFERFYRAEPSRSKTLKAPDWAWRW